MTSLTRIIPARLLCALVVGGLLLFSHGMTSVHAQVTASESRLVFNGLQADAQQRTFSIEGNPLPTLQVVLHDLLDAKTGVVILSSNIKVTRARESGANREDFNVTVSGATRPGHYVGELDIMNAAQQPATKLLAITLDVMLRGAPAVEADVNSKALTVRLRQPFGDFAYVGQPGSIANPAQTPAPGLREHEIYLVQSGEQAAIVQGAEILGMRASAGNDLPPGVIRVSSSFPFNIGGGGSASLKVVTGGNNLEAGEYNGTLQVNVTEQKAPVKIPIKMLIKHGPLLALIVLVGGLLVAFLFGWWNSKGKATRDLVKPIQQLEEEINTGKNLQIEEREEAMLILRRAMAGIEDGDSPEEVKKRLDAAQAYVTAAQTAAQDFITGKLEPLMTRTKGIAPGEKIRQMFVKTIEDIRRNIVGGKYLRLDDAKSSLPGTEKQVTIFENTVKKFNDVPEDKRAETAKKMDAAATLEELRQALRDAGVEVKEELKAAFDLKEMSLPMADAPKRFELSLRRQLQLSVGAAAITIIAFLFILAVGWISIYAKSDTFGANPMDYITLFLWGATAEAVRGKTISLTSLKGVVTEQRPAS